MGLGITCLVLAGIALLQWIPDMIQWTRSGSGSGSGSGSAGANDDAGYYTANKAGGAVRNPLDVDAESKLEEGKSDL